MRIAVIGAAGKAGTLTVHEAARRGHAVLAVARDVEQLTDRPEGVRAVAADITDAQSIAPVVASVDAVIVTVAGPDIPFYENAVRTLSRVVAGVLPESRPRIVHMGGAGSLLDADGQRLVDGPDFPSAWKPAAEGQARALDIYRSLDRQVTWTYVSPAPLLVDGERTGEYRTGTDEPVVGVDGRSEISYPDFAAALLDEVERPAHVGARFTVGY